MTRIDLAAFWEIRQARNGPRLVKELATNGRRQRQRFFLVQSGAEVESASGRFENGSITELL